MYIYLSYGKYLYLPLVKIHPCSVEESQFTAAILPIQFERRLHMKLPRLKDLKHHTLARLMRVL